VRYLTDFADQAVVLPLVLAIAAALLLQGWRRGALVWLAVVGATLGVMLALKLAFLSCTPVFGPWDVRSPSGHVAAATVVTGGLMALLTRRRTTMLPVALLAATVIGLSRLLLGVHSLPEVAIGAIVGLVGAAALQRLAGPPPRLKAVPLLLTVAVVTAVFHGLHLPAEAAIRHTALSAARFLDVCRVRAVIPEYGPSSR
jgi:membrane-associated phospholipid phosphatase